MPLHNTNSRPPPRPRPGPKQPQASKSNTPPSTIPPKLLYTPNLVTLDGRTLEGGGQLVRVALTLSALLRIPVYIHHVRGKRSSSRSQRSGGGGGLKESHLAAVEFLARECGAQVYGAEVGGMEVLFLPGKGGTPGDSDHVIELKNPGSVWLIFQAIYPFLLFRGGRGRGTTTGGDEDEQPKVVKLTVRGGTNVSMSMSAEYVQQVLLPVLEKIGLPKTEIVIKKRGWTHGRVEVGEVEVRVTPLTAGQRLEGFRIRESTGDGDGRAVTKITISVIASPAAMLEHLVLATEEGVRAYFPEVGDVEVLVSEDSGDARRMYLLLVAHLEGGWRIGRDWLFDGKLKNNDPMAIARQIAERVVADLNVELDRGGCVDEFLQDQLVIFQALASGKSEVDVGIGRGEGSEHTRTVKWVVEQMLGRDMFAGNIVDGCGCLVNSDRPAAPSQENVDALEKGVGAISLD